MDAVEEDRFSVSHVAPVIRNGPPSHKTANRHDDKPPLPRSVIVPILELNDGAGWDGVELLVSDASPSGPRNGL